MYRRAIAACPIGSRLGPLTLSKVLAVTKAISASSHAISYCPADAGSTFPPTFPARRRRACWLCGDGRPPKSPGPKPAPQAAVKKSRHGEEPVNAPRVDRVAPGEAPQPLTLNHPALAPAATSSRGSSHLQACRLSLFRADGEVIAVDYLDTAAKSENAGECPLTNTRGF